MVAVAKSSIFLGWTASQGIETPLDLAHRVNERYMTCKDDVSAGDDILRIPLSSCITADTLESLAGRLAYERDLGSKSKYAPYIDVLPTLEGDDERPSLLSLPRFWDANRLEKVTDGGRLEAKMRNDERKDIDPWALACVDSRANFLGGERYSMTPILDMINHDGTVPTRARVNEDKGFSGSGDILCLTSGQSYSKGEEAFISYGNLANIDTLSDYGFIAENNPCNSESVGVRMMGRDPFSVNVFADGSVDSGAKATLRYYLANEEELEIFQSLDTKGSGIGILAKHLSERNEIDVQSFIASTLDEAAYDAKSGAADAKSDGLVSSYLNERAKLLEKAIQRIKTKYPGLEY